jgi:C4-type Zn-finger protein
VAKLKELSSGSKFPISIRIKDPSGNSNIKNPYAPKVDKNLHISNVPRTLEDLVAMGYSV